MILPRHGHMPRKPNERPPPRIDQRRGEGWGAPGFPLRDSRPPDFESLLRGPGHTRLASGRTCPRQQTMNDAEHAF